MKKTNLLLFILLLVAPVALNAQQENSAFTQMSKYVRNIETFNRLVPQEKVYLHFDNTSYVLGETIWFKAYVVTAGQLQPTNQSSVLYVELLNSKGKVLETKKLKIEDGQSRGEFALEEINVEYFPGFYEVRAYTKGMLNFGEDVVFSRVFPVFKEFKLNGDYTKKELEDELEIQLPNHRQKAKKQNKINVDFYPEGGNLVNGLTSNVAFQITDEEGNRLETGSFAYTPEGKKNTTKITYENKEYLFGLPASLDQGYVLQANNLAENTLILQVEKSPNLPSTPLGLSVLCRGEVVYFQGIEIEDTPYRLEIPKENLLSGVNQITLFDTKGEIFAERMIFIAPKEEEQVFIEAISDKEEYQPQERINIDLTITGESVYPGSVVSIAVRDANQLVETADAGNIATNLLLSSDLKGYIENPSYYLEKENAQALDLLLLVRGWKRYEWQTMAGVKPFSPQFNIEKSLTIKGRIADPDGKNTKVGALLQQASLSMKETTKTNKDGVFYFYPEDFYGTWELTLLAKGLEKSGKIIRLDRWFSPTPQPYSLQATGWKENPLSVVKKSKFKKEIKEIQSYNDSIKRAYLIPEFVVKTQRKRNKDLIHNVGSDIDQLIDNGKKIPYNVHDYLLRYDQQYNYYDAATPPQDVNFTSTSASFHPLSVSNNPLYLQGSVPRKIAFYHLDDGKWNQLSYKVVRTGKRNFDVERREMTKDRTILDVEKIIVPGINKYEETGNVTDQNGQYLVPINIYPYQNYVMRTITGTRYTTFDGYSKAKDFYWDRQEREDYVANEYEHQRTLYWNPDVKTDNQGEAHIYFYNNVFTRYIDISAEGLTKEGSPIITKNK